MRMTAAPRVVRPQPTLENGERMRQPEFHRRYQEFPSSEKFELIGGVVYMASPLRQPHGSYEQELSYALMVYKAGTIGVEALANTTTVLGPDSEPQPDLALRILAEYGGQSEVDANQYLIGPPELVAEVAHSTRSLDLNEKRDDYRRAGVREYLVYSVEQRKLDWFHFASRRPIEADRRGVFRSRVFPGLWVDSKALMNKNSIKIAATVQLGLASPAHAAFVERLRLKYDSISKTR